MKGASDLQGSTKKECANGGSSQTENRKGWRKTQPPLCVRGQTSIRFQPHEDSGRKFPDDFVVERNLRCRIDSRCRSPSIAGMSSGGDSAIAEFTELDRRSRPLNSVYLVAHAPASFPASLPARGLIHQCAPLRSCVVSNFLAGRLLADHAKLEKTRFP